MINCIINNLPIMYLLEKKDNEYIIDTSFLDNYEYREGM
jgi:hypothetical protein